VEETIATACLTPKESQSSLSVIVPVFNSSSTLRTLVQAIDAALPGIEKELILINDGSRDGSWAVIRDLSNEFTWVHGINLMRNYGQHNALLCGIRAAHNEIIATIDDDLQNPPTEVPKLLTKLSEGYDVVYGTPLKESHGFMRDVASRITKIALQNAMGAETAKNVSAFRVFRSKLRVAFERYSGPYVSIDVLLTWSTQSFAAIPVQNPPRSGGVSGYTTRKLITHAMNMLTGFSTLPLQIGSIIGFILTVFGVAILLFVTTRYLISGGVVPGFSFLASIISIFSGAQLFALGIFGEYLARVHTRTMDKPPYAVQATTDARWITTS
jgi:undecaprenyl-phosphate 4-deoxy-4-formamido-L-arabinose transferase